MKNKLILSLLTISSLLLNIAPANSSPDIIYPGTIVEYPYLEQALEKVTDLEVLIPRDISDEYSSEEYPLLYEVYGYKDKYFINAVSVPGCVAHVCWTQTWSGEKGNHLQIDKDTPVIKYVELENGYKAVYTNGCSPTAMNICTSYLSWMINGTTYSLSGKLDSDQLINLANSIYN